MTSAKPNTPNPEDHGSRETPPPGAAAATGAKHCTGETKAGAACRAFAGRDSALCFAHDPARAGAMDEARELGGRRRRREKMIYTALNLEELATLPGLGRVIEMALLDTLQLENSIARSRTVAMLASVHLKWFELDRIWSEIEQLQQLPDLAGREGLR